MSAFAALIPTDLSRIDLLRNGSPGEHWIASPAGDAPDADALRRRVTESTRWCARQCGNRRLTAVLDVHEAGCRWIHAPSSAPLVVAASLRNQGEEWASVAPVGGVQPLANNAQDGNGTGEQMVAITMPDALARLWLDGLDRLGSRVSTVITLWHAAISAWGNAPAGTLQAIVLVDDAKRLVWAWCDGGDLITGGQVRLLDHPAANPDSTTETHRTDPAQAAASRLALDWAAWSTQLGRTPSTVRIVGAEALPGLDAALQRRLDSISIDHVDERDALVATLRRTGEHTAAGPPQTEPTHCLTHLAKRPGRTLRWSYRTWGAALLVLSAGLAIVGVRTWSLATHWNDQTAVVRTELTNRVNEEFGDEYQPQPGQNPLTWLRNLLASTNQSGSNDELPPAPRKMYEAASTMLALVAKAEGNPKLTKLHLSQANNDNYIQLRGIVQTEAYTFIEMLKDEGTPLAWELAGSRISTTNQNIRLNGTWQQQEEE